jgi:hypothetical protein
MTDSDERRIRTTTDASSGLWAAPTIAPLGASLLPYTASTTGLIRLAGASYRVPIVLAGEPVEAVVRGASAARSASRPSLDPTPSQRRESQRRGPTRPQSHVDHVKQLPELIRQAGTGT